MTSYSFVGKVALVTGGGSGIGEACAKAFAKGGAEVVISDLDDVGGVRVSNDIRTQGGKATFIRADVSQADSVREMVEGVVNTYGHLDIAVNNAGIGGESKPIGEVSVENWQKVIGVNLNGVFYGMRYQIPQMLAGTGGVIINMASILGSVGFARAAAYVAAKHGVVGLTKSAAIEYGEQGIRVNSVGPGFIKTPLLDENLDASTLAALASLHPIGRIGEAIEVANLVMFLCSDEASFITGSYFTVDGAYTAQ